MTAARSDTPTEEQADPRPVFYRAADQTQRAIAGVRGDQLEDPTPCTQFDVRTLLGHLLAVFHRIDTIAHGGSAFDVPRVAEGVHHDNWAGAFAEVRARIERGWADDAVLQQIFDLPFGRLPGAVALRIFTCELAAHTWDLAVATGQQLPGDEEVGAVALAAGRTGIPAEPRGGDFPFAPVVPVPGDADVYDRLAGWLGRDPAAYR